MAIGDIAAAAGIPVVDGSTTPARTIDTEINRTRDILAERTEGVADAIAKVDAATPSGDLAGNGGKLVRFTGDGKIGVATPTSAAQAANKGYVDAAVAGAGGGKADGPTSAAYNRGATGSGYFAVWMNSALQFMRNTSSRRYKKNIRDWTGDVLGLRTVIFDRRGRDAEKDEVGFIAEEVADVLPDALVYFDGRIDGINDRVILAAAVATIQRQQVELDLLAQRLEALEGGAQ